MLVIRGVLPGSAASRRGIMPGDSVLAVNGRPVGDVVDFLYHADGERLSLSIRSPGRRPRTVLLRTVFGETPGIEFEPLQVRRCRNNCIFCFVDQMPAGCRKSLSVKDDDYRASFLFGNYITLGNLLDEDWERIIAQRISPLYVSVHATEPGVRYRIFRTRDRQDIMARLRRLAEHGIRVHTQIVLAPGINDGPHLERTVTDLASLAPSVQSIAVVPVGLTRHRKGLYPLRTYGKREARKVIGAVGEMGDRFLGRHGTRLVFASDEFYVQAGLDVPPAAFYEDFPQLENGVGLIADFLHDAAGTKVPEGLSEVSAMAVTGVSFGPILKKCLKERLWAAPQVKVRVLAVRNRFLGSSVTVAGLLAGRDILAAIKGRKPGRLLFIPSSSLKDGEEIFLDDMTLAELTKAAGVPVVPVSTLRGMIRALRRRAPARRGQ